MQSRLLDSLLAEATTTPDRVTWARAVCRAAAHMARSGQPDHALNSIGLVREKFGPGLHPDVASWLMLAEGIVHFCDLKLSSAYDRIQRAYGLAVALQNTPAVPSCAAWLAAIELNFRQQNRMAAHIKESWALASPSDHQARSRAALVMATALQIAGDFDKARPWYEKAKFHANAEGDETAVSALLFNMAICRLIEARLNDAFEVSQGPGLARASAEAAGSYSFDIMTSNSSQEPWRVLLHGQMLLMSGRYTEAIACLSSTSVERLTDNRSAALILIERAWCHLKLNSFAEAVTDAQASEARLSDVVDLEDKAYIFKRLSQIYSTATPNFDNTELESAGKCSLDEFRKYQRDLIQSIDGIAIL